MIRILPAVSAAHVVADLVDQIDGTGHVGLDDVPRLVKILVEESMAQATPGVCEQRIDRSAVGRGIKLIDALGRRQVGLKGFHLTAPAPRSDVAACSMAGSSAAIRRS